MADRILTSTSPETREAMPFAEFRKDPKSMTLYSAISVTNLISYHVGIYKRSFEFTERDSKPTPDSVWCHST